MTRYRTIPTVLFGFMLVIFMASGSARGHEVIGEVTPLMLHMNHTLSFLKNGREAKALRMAEEVYEDFEAPMRNEKESGLKTNSSRVDRSFGTDSEDLLSTAITQKDANGLRKAMEGLSFLLSVPKNRERFWVMN